jgi:hypothetical protein
VFEGIGIDGTLADPRASLSWFFGRITLDFSYIEGPDKDLTTMKEHRSYAATVFLALKARLGKNYNMVTV